MFALLTGKYRNIIFAIGLFILLDASILGMNFYISFALSGDAVAVSQAGQAQMMSQRLMKALYELQVAMTHDGDSRKAFEELKATYQGFDETLNAFQHGGSISLGRGEVVELAAVSDTNGRELLRRMSEVWQPFKNLVYPLINVPAPSHEHWFLENLNEAEIYAAANNLTLLDMSSDLADHLESVATSKAERLRWVQTIGISLAVINFMIIIFHFIRQLRETDEQIQQARDETRRILDTVGEGLFLLDRDFIISSEHSLFAEKLFGDKNIAGSNFLDLFRNRVSEKDLQTVHKYLKLLLEGQINENLVTDLNPLQEVKLAINNEHGQFENKYVRFSFNCSYEDNQVVQILVTAQDVTDKVKLKQEVKRLHSSQNDQVSILSKILALNPGEFYNFIHESLTRLHKINAILQQPSRKLVQFHAQIHEISAELHRFKGDASMMSMDKIANELHAMEDIVLGLAGREDLEGDDFLPVTVRLKGLLRELEQYQQLAEQLKRIAVEPLQDDSNTIINRDQLHNLVKSVAGKNNKQIELQLQQRGKQFIPEAMLQQIRDIVVQLVRNSVTHGIEPVHMRGEKNRNGTIKVHMAANRDELLVSVFDDGKGIDLEALRNKALQSGLAKTRTEVQAWPVSRLIKLIFEPGMSTADSVDEDAGRGIGMMAVRQMVNRLQGKMAVQNEPGQFCRFTIRFPLSGTNSLAKVS